MAPTAPRKEIKVLVTGYGPFMKVVNNPSWLAVKELHNLRLDLDREVDFASPSTSNGTAQAGKGNSVHIQCIQMPVHYGSVLDTVPRLHGLAKSSSPHAKLWFDSRCDQTGLAGQEGKSYPEGYAIEHPPEGYDVILHVGIGSRGGMECETLAHKLGYNHPDTNSCLGPIVQEVGGAEGPVGAQGGEKALGSEHLVKDGKLRGFGEGYEQYDEEERTPIDVPDLVNWLKAKGMNDDIKQSFDAGRYLCDFIFYCSLAESKRAAEELSRRRTDSMFIHIPPVGDRLSTETCTAAIRCIAWYCASKRLVE